MQDLSTDLFNNWRSTNDGAMALFSFTSADGTFESYYKNNYATINYANAMIKYAGAESALGSEGRFIRGLCYYNLTQQFGAVPYQTDYIMSSSRDYPRTPLDEVYSNVISDLKELYANCSLPATDRTVNA